MAIKTSYIKCMRDDKTSTFDGSLTVKQNLTFGDASTDTLTVTGPMTNTATTATGLTMSGTYSTAAIAITSATGGKMTMTVTAETASDPGRQLYLQRTYTGDMGSGKGLTGIEVRSTFNGSADEATCEVKGGEFKARHTSANTKNVGTFKGVVGNCDSKSGAKTITSAWAVEGQIDCGTGSTITTAAGCRVAYNEDGTVTNAYGIYVDGTSVWDVGVKITDSKAITGIDVGNCTTGIAFGTATTGINFADSCTTGIDFSSGTYSVGIDMTDVKINGSDDDLSLFRMGGYDTANTITSALTANTFGLSVNIDNQINSTGAQWLAGIYCKTQLTTASCSNVSSVSLMVRGLIKRACAAYYGIQSHVKFEAGSAQDVSSEVIALSGMLYGTAASGTGLYWGVKSDIRTTNAPTSRQTSACFFGVGTVSIGSGLYIEPLATTTMIAGINLHAAGNMTNAIYVAGTGNVTNFLQFDTAAGCVASETGTTCAGDGYKIKVIIGGSTFYLRAASDWT